MLVSLTFRSMSDNPNQKIFHAFSSHGLDSGIDFKKWLVLTVRIHTVLTINHI